MRIAYNSKEETVFIFPTNSRPAREWRVLQDTFKKDYVIFDFDEFGILFCVELHHAKRYFSEAMLNNMEEIG